MVDPVAAGRKLDRASDERGDRRSMRAGAIGLPFHRGEAGKLGQLWMLPAHDSWQVRARWIPRVVGRGGWRSSWLPSG